MPPAHPKRIALVNPTKFLGNLLLAGHLIQTFCQHCEQRGIRVLLVLDEAFAELFAEAFAGAELVFYPRQALGGKSGKDRIAGLRGWLRCVRQLRAFRADMAFTLEEDSVCHRLTHLSGARYKISSTVHRYHTGFDEVLDVARSGRPAAESSIWYSFREVFYRVGFPMTLQPQYVRLTLRIPDNTWLASLGLDSQGVADAGSRPIAVLHAGASKSYKKWPIEHFVALARLLLQRNYRLVLIGAGNSDAEANRAIVSQLVEDRNTRTRECVDLCNRLSLAQLASLLTRVAVMVGNDSGPSHLASALGVQGVVIFGPTDLGIWRPLGSQTLAMANKSVCQADCTRHHCRSGYSCLRSISPEQVMTRLFTNRQHVTDRQHDVPTDSMTSDND